MEKCPVPAHLRIQWHGGAWSPCALWQPLPVGAPRGTGSVRAREVVFAGRGSERKTASAWGTAGVGASGLIVEADHRMCWLAKRSVRTAALW